MTFSIYVVDEDSDRAGALLRRLKRIGLSATQLVSGPHPGNCSLPGCIVYAGDNLTQFCRQVSSDSIELPVVALAGGSLDARLWNTSFRPFDVLPPGVDDDDLKSTLMQAIRCSQVRRDSNRRHASIERARETLTQREAQVFDQLLLGHSTKQIARSLAIEPKSVARHVARVLRKMGVENQATLVRLVLTDELTRRNGVFFSYPPH